jgi:integrase
MSRRMSGEGSIYPIKDDNGKTIKYAGSLTIGYQGGKRLRKKIERKTRREVADELARLRAKQSDGGDLTAKQPTFREFADAWLDKTFGMRAKPKSVQTYRQMFKYYLFPALGDLKVEKVRYMRVQALVTDLHEQGLADKTISLVRAAGRQMYIAAIKAGLTTHNPFQGLTLPRGRTRKAKAFTLEQAKAFLKAARGERLEVALRLMLSLGLRRGEVCGLRWDVDVDLKAGTLAVNGHSQYIQGQGNVWDTPKSESGVRTFKLPPSLVAALTWHRRRQEEERRLMGDRWEETLYVFVGVTNGRALNSGMLYDVFKRVARAAELPTDLTPHSLRHSAASFLRAEGADLKKISVYLGHANTTITNQIYVHLFQAEIDEAAAAVEDLLAETGT